MVNRGFLAIGNAAEKKINVECKKMKTRNAAINNRKCRIENVGMQRK